MSASGSFRVARWGGLASGYASIRGARNFGSGPIFGAFSDVGAEFEETNRVPDTDIPPEIAVGTTLRSVFVGADLLGVEVEPVGGDFDPSFELRVLITGCQFIFGFLVLEDAFPREER